MCVLRAEQEHVVGASPAGVKVSGDGTRGRCLSSGVKCQRKFQQQKLSSSNKSLYIEHEAHDNYKGIDSDWGLIVFLRSQLISLRHKL